MSETTKLKFTSPIEKYLDQIGHWFVITTTRMIAVRRERKGAKARKASWRAVRPAAQADAASAPQLSRALTPPFRQGVR